MRTCTSCGRRFEIAAFVASDGRLSEQCAACRKALSRDHPKLAAADLELYWHSSTYAHFAQLASAKETG
jgi:hypothetical protein